MPKFQCACGAKYRFPDSAMGKKAKCKRCGVVFTLEVDEDGPIPIAKDPPDFGDSPLVDKVAAAESRVRSLPASDRPRVSGPSPFPPGPLKWNAT